VLEIAPGDRALRGSRLKPAGKQRAQRQAFERCAQLAEHVLNTRALGEIALFVRVFAVLSGISCIQ